MNRYSVRLNKTTRLNTYLHTCGTVNMSEDFSTLTGVSPALVDGVVSEALTKWFGEPVTFTQWEYVGEIGKGDSYLSEVIKIRIYGKDQNGVEKHVQVILKSIPKSISRRLTYRSDEFFSNEINFYKIVLPALLEFQASKNIKDPFTNYAELFLSYSDGVNDVICLEDASLQNYGPAVRQEGVDLTHCIVSLNALAKFHAISYAMRDQKPEKFNKIAKVLQETYYDDKVWPWYERFWARLCKVAINAVETEYPNSKYSEKIKSFAVPEHYKKMVQIVKESFDNGCISHGDCWTNNFLYKYDKQDPCSALLIDFQLSRCASPVLDISFFIYACTTQDLRLKHYEELLNYYYGVLSKQIRDMGSDPEKVYSWMTFYDEVKKYSQFGLAFSFESTPFIVLPPEEAFNMDMEGDEKKNIADIGLVEPFKTKEGRLREANNVVHSVDNNFI